MSEGYLIVNATADNNIEVNLLINSIKKIDKERPVSVITNSSDMSFFEADNIIYLEEGNPTLRYFKSLLLSPYIKTIGLLPDQILTSFDTSVWENLRGLSSIILPETRYSFNDQAIDYTAYGITTTEFKSFGASSITNAIFFNKDKSCDDVLGLASVLCANYDQDNYIDFFADKENEMPTFPKYIWSSWILSLLQTITPDKISTYDFVHCIDLSKQENNISNYNWTSNWNTFLTHWVNEEGILKIENFVQSGLVKYETNSWLTDDILENFKTA